MVCDLRYVDLLICFERSKQLLEIFFKCSVPSAIGGGLADGIKFKVKITISHFQLQYTDRRLLC